MNAGPHHPHHPQPDAGRRRFLAVTALGALGFVIGCGEAGAALQPPRRKRPRTTTFNAFVRVGSDNTVTVVIKHLDKGQGVTTGLTTIVAEELDAAWSQMRWEFAPADAKRYNNLFFGKMQGTGGSTSIANSWQQLREAGAAARAMLIGAAAQQWNVPAAEIGIENGVLRHASGRRATFGELAPAASQIAPPAAPTLKDPRDFKLVGRHVTRIDTPEKTSGRALYTMDFQRPGMLHAVVLRPPRFGAKLQSFDAKAALAHPGVVECVAIPRGVAVVAKSFWAAHEARRLVTATWDETQAETRGTPELFAEFKRLAATPGTVARRDGDAEVVLAQAAKVLRAEFELPYLAHAPMEPLNAVVELHADRAEIWTGSQSQTLDQSVVAHLAGLNPEQVEIHTLFAGGSFGRRAVPDSDYIAEAVTIAKGLKRTAPVKLQWSREDDLRGGRYRPMSVHSLAAALDDRGRLAAWTHRIVVQSFLKRSRFDAMVKDGIDPTAVEGAKDLPYAIDHVSVDVHNPEVGVPTLWWRSVGHTHTAFATEVFLDEVAAATGEDPIALRRRLLARAPRHLGVLELAVANAGPAPGGPGQGRGVAVHKSFGSYVAEIADVSVAADGAFKVDRVVCAVDCGLAVNPDIVRAQMEGGIGYALGAAMREAITLEAGRVVESNFHDYRPLRIDEMPIVEVHIVPSAEAPSGVGEPGVPPLAPAVANALRAATGKPVRKLPFVAGGSA